MATGFGAWGLTLGTAAGLDIAARIGGAPTAYGSWSPLRAGLVRFPGTSATIAGRTVGNLVGSLLPHGGDESARSRVRGAWSAPVPTAPPCR